MKIILIEPLHFSSVCRTFKFLRKNGKSYFFEKMKKSDIPDYDEEEKRCLNKTVLAIVDDIHLDKIKEFNDRKHKLFFDYLDAEKALTHEFKTYLKGINIDD